MVAFKLEKSYTDLYEFFDSIDAVYIATPHTTHYEFAKKALLQNKHVLCEKPMVLQKDQAEELFSIAKAKNLVLFEAIKTVYTPCFTKLINMAKSGVIGNIVDVTATLQNLLKIKP